MSNLMSANLIRMRKNVWFLFSLLFMFCLGVAAVIDFYREIVKYDSDHTPDKGFGGYIIPVCILLAVLCCIFCGEEYDEGTIRNKVSAGLSRNKIYLSQLLSCFAAGISMSLVYLIPETILGVILLGDFYRSTDELLAYLLSGILLTAACVSVYCLIIAAIQSRNAGTVITILILLVTVYFGIILKQRIDMPSEYSRVAYDDEAGEYVILWYDNPHYPKGALRIFLETMYVFLPSTQAYQIFYMTSENIPGLMISSVIISVLSILTGLKIFRKKDLK